MCYGTIYLTRIKLGRESDHFTFGACGNEEVDSEQALQEVLPCGERNEPTLDSGRVGACA